MRKLFTLSYSLFFVLIVAAQRDYTSLVNPFIGTGGHGHTYPGASMPFGMMQLSPDTRGADWDGSSGYHYSDSVIYGFTHTHLSGTGIPDYCDILFMPFTGDVQWDPKAYKSGFDHKTEKASPGYYEVLLAKNNIKARLTTSIRSGMHEYEFPSSTADRKLLIDLKWRDEVLDAYIEKVNNHSIQGYRRSKSWAQDQMIYFYVEFEQPISTFVIAQENQTAPGNKAQRKNIKASLSFATAQRNVRCRIGISGVSLEGAVNNLHHEINTWDFNTVYQSAKQSWNKELSKIDIKGGTKDQQTAFYTALYHTLLVPNIYQDVDGQYRGTDQKVHKADVFTNYSVFSLWDTYRAYHPLMTIINQRRTKDWINTFLWQYKNGGMLPVWELSGNETFCMVGYHSVPVIVDAYQKGIRGFDTQLALEAMRSYAESNRFGLDSYRKYGYLSNDVEHESVSKTLEYAYDDWCIATFAKALKNDSVYTNYIKRAQYYKNVFDPETHHMRGKVQAMWYSPFDPKEINNFYTEGNSWQYTFAVPQDIQTLIALHGGRDSFAKKLTELFTTSTQTTGREQADVTGLIGQYAQGNEPSHHMAYLFNYAGMPWKTQELIHKICTEFYINTPDGLIGNEDCGQMSAWFILSSMGFYPVCPGTGEYVLGTPLFDEVTIHLENGKQFVVQTKNRSANNYYVGQTTYNGKSYSNSYLTHGMLQNGGQFQFVLSAKPNIKWGVQSNNLPHSKITDHPIVPAPYFAATSNKFRDNITVSVQDLLPDARMNISIDGKSNELSGYDRIIIKKSTDVTATASQNGSQSKTVVQRFYKVPSDRSISVLSKVHPMYTAGGPDALIDGIEGTSNWRTGEWQSYFDQNFEAVIDLQQKRPVKHVGIHVLQDVSPWIIFPKEVIFYSSDDGEHFTEATRVKNIIEPKDMAAQVQELGIDVNLQTRFIKVKAINGGKLPAWHESAGNASHLFIDEVIVK